MAIVGLSSMFEQALNSILSINMEVQQVEAIRAVGVSLTTMFFAMEIFSQMAEFRVERIEDAIRIGMKFVVAKVIIENSSGIVIGIKNMLMTATGDTFGTAFSGINSAVSEMSISANKGGFLGSGYFLLSVFLMLAFIVFFATYISILINIVGIFFEIGIHQAIAPVALSTLCNNTARSAGISFIKSYSAVCLQLTVIGVILNVFATISPKFTGLKISSSAGEANIFEEILKLLIPIILLVVLSKAIKTAGDTTKRMLGA